MAAPTIDPILTNVTLADNLTNWAGFNDGSGGAGSDVLEQDIAIQGSPPTAVSKKVSGSSRDEGLIYQTATTVDISADANKHVYAWIAFTTKGLLETIAGGGIYIRLEDSAGNWSKWYLDGSDTLEATVLFKRYVIDTSKTPSEISGTLDLADIEYWGVGVKTHAAAGTSKSENLVVDRIDYGTGLRIEDGDATDPCNWLALNDDDALAANKYGIIEELEPGVYSLLGAVAIGDPTSKTTLWDDSSGATVVFRDPQYYDGARLVSAIDHELLYQIVFQGNGTGTTDITFGDVVGSGDDRQGISGGSIGSAGPRFTIDGETDIAELDTVNLYGVTLSGAGVTQFSSSTKTDLIGCTFVGCDEVQPNDAEFLNNLIIAPKGRGLEMLSTHNVKQVSFIAGADVAVEALAVWQVDESTAPDTGVWITDDFNGAGAGNPGLFPATPATNDYCLFGYSQPFGKLTIDLSTLGIGGVVAWEYWNGSTWSDLGETDGTSNLTADGDVAWPTPADWAATTVAIQEVTTAKDTEQLYCVRARITTTYSTDPTINSTGTSAVDDVLEHHIRHPANGSFTYTDLEFFGHSPAGTPKWHGENPAVATVLESYNDSNRDSAGDYASGGIEKWAQEVIGDGNKIASVDIALLRTGTLTGDITCTIYDSDDGSPPEPTGSVLATSAAVAASSVGTSWALVRFEFEDELTLTNTQTYFFSIDYVEAGGGNLQVGQDTSSPTADGTLASWTLAGGWAGTSGQALAGFDVHTDPLVINASGSSNPTRNEFEDTGSPAGTTIVNNPITYTVEGLVTGTEVRIFTDPGGVELAGVESSGTSFAYQYNYAGDVDVYVIIQHVDYLWRRVDDTLGNSDKTIPANQLPDPDYRNP